MKRILALAATLLIGSLSFAQTTEDDYLYPSEKALDQAGLVLKRVENALERARVRLERRSLHIIWISEDRPSDGEFVPLQISWVPGLAIPFGYYDVGLSFGAVGALTRDVQGIAYSNVFNISRDVQGVELAGVFNIGRKVDGAQLGGVFNIAGAGVQGAQLAGVFNIANGPMGGAQLGGVFNIAGEVQGFQAAGLFDIAESYRGPVQVAGLFTIAGDMRGTQLSGLFTVADRLRGAQISPIVNIAGRAEGLQVGLINIADHIDGVQLGLINIAKNGVGGVGELFEGNSDYQWAFWQNGTPWFYTVFMAGAPKGDWGSTAANLVLSAGAGSRMYLGRSYIDLEIAALEAVGSSVVSFQNDPGAVPAMSSLNGFSDALVRAASLSGRPWPALRISFGVPLLWRLHLIAGARVDFDLDDFPGLPESMKTGIVAKNQNWLGGLGFSTYTKWYFGFRI
jgi:hypothetical protein